jgi:rRNA maturation endonuclease Nob1
MQFSNEHIKLNLGVEHAQNLNYFRFILKQQKYFLICENCFWMASTLYPLSNMPKIKFKECPICKSKLDRFSIPNSN